MKKLFTLLMFLTFTFPVFGGLTGYQIAYKVKYKNEPSTSVSFAVLKLYSSANSYSPSETRKVVMKSKRVGARGNKNVVMRFTERRSSYRGTTFLSIERKGRETVNYIRLKTQGRARQLSSYEKQNNFVDTDFTNENLGGIKLNEYRFKRISDLTRNGKKYYRVWAFKKDSGAKYPKYLAIIDKNKFVATEMRIFNKNGRLAKIAKASDIRKVAGKYWYPFKMEVKDLISNHKTAIVLSKMIVNKYVRSSFFRSGNMARTWPEDRTFN